MDFPGKIALVYLTMLVISASGSWSDPAQNQTTGVFYNWGATRGLNFHINGMGIGSYLFDNDGKLLHSWSEPDGLPPVTIGYISEEGTLLRGGRIPSDFFVWFPLAGGTVREYSKSGQCIWEFRYSSTLYRHTPAFVILPNGNLLVSAWENHPYFNAARKGYNLNNIVVDGNNTDPYGFWTYTLVEVPRKGRDNPEYDENSKDFDGNVYNTCKTYSDERDLVWKWDLFDHMSSDIKRSKWDINKQFDLNVIDYLPSRDHIAIMCFECGEVFVIDHSVDTKKAKGSDGDFIYRWGNPINYGVEGPNRLMSKNLLWVRDNFGWKFEKEGALSILNNVDIAAGVVSSLVQLTPPYEKGKYLLRDDGTYGPDDFDFKIAQIQEKLLVEGDYGYIKGKFYPPEFEYPYSTFFSPPISSGQQLPNGNIFAGISNEGWSFEVNMKEQSVWKYVSPYINNNTRDGFMVHDTVLGKYDEIPVCTRLGELCNNIPKMIKYSPYYKGFNYLFN